MTSTEPAPKQPPELLYLLAGEPEEFAFVTSGMQSADIADALLHLPEEAAARVLAALPTPSAAAVLDDPALERYRPDIIRHLDDATAGRLIDAMAGDQQAELFRNLVPSDQKRLLELVSPETRASVGLLLQYPSDTAGGIMTPEFVSVPDEWTAAQTLAHIRAVGNAKETVYAIYVVDSETSQLVHVISLREVIMAPPDDRVIDIGYDRPPVTVRPLADREEVARIIGRYNLLAIPVVNGQGRVMGIVTVDDVIDALVQEETEDVHKFGGMEALDVPYMEIGFGAMIKKRAGWLCALFLGEMLTATAMQHFEGELAKAVVLTLFIPLIMSSGGNSGSQATSLIIRALALREVKVGDWWRIALRELPSGLVLGCILGVIGVLRISIWQTAGFYDYGAHWVLVALTVGGALIGVVTFGSLAGSMLPFALKRVGFDPASASAPFVATLVDVTGLVIYFTVALVLLRGTLL
ncbi:MAG: magnesium transporter [Gemmatimonadota bacterium]